MPEAPQREHPQLVAGVTLASLDNATGVAAAAETPAPVDAAFDASTTRQGQPEWSQPLHPLPPLADTPATSQWEHATQVAPVPAFPPPATAAAATHSGQVQAPGLPFCATADVQRSHLQPVPALPAAAAQRGQPQSLDMLSFANAAAAQRVHPQPHPPALPTVVAQCEQLQRPPVPPAAAAAAQWGHPQPPSVPPAAAAAAQWEQPDTEWAPGVPFSVLSAAVAAESSPFACDGEADGARESRGLPLALPHPHPPPDAGNGGRTPYGAAAAGEAPARAAQVGKASPSAAAASLTISVATDTATRAAKSTATPIASGATWRGGAMSNDHRVDFATLWEQTAREGLPQWARHNEATEDNTRRQPAAPRSPLRNPGRARRRRRRWTFGPVSVLPRPVVAAARYRGPPLSPR